MTEEIDLDKLDVASDDEETPNRGDWFWRDEGDPADEPDGPAEMATATDAATADTDASATTAETGDSPAASETEETDVSDARVPHVPRENKNKPVGIPKESGGAGGETAAASSDEGPHDEYPDEPEETASGPHGGGIDDMTLALTYRAMKQVEQPPFVVREARAWADWIGIVGGVDSFVINKFQRDHNIDVDFFSGSGQTAPERLADIDKHSMFYAERMVVVGLDDEEELAERAGWEFVPLEEAAEGADWELIDDE